MRLLGYLFWVTIRSLAATMARVGNYAGNAVKV